MSVDEIIKEQVRQEVDRALEEKLPEIIRALGIREAEPAHDGYVDALEVARFLGKDLSTPKNIVKAKKHVYHLAAQKLIPSVRLSERNIRFDLVKVKEALAARESRAA
jgi:hypothetical protein